MIHRLITVWYWSKTKLCETTEKKFNNNAINIHNNIAEWATQNVKHRQNWSRLLWIFMARMRDLFNFIWGLLFIHKYLMANFVPLESATLGKYCPQVGSLQVLECSTPFLAKDGQNVSYGRWIPSPLFTNQDFPQSWFSSAHSFWADQDW